jgi:hypothetical protein
MSEPTEGHDRLGLTEWSSTVIPWIAGPSACETMIVLGMPASLPAMGHSRQPLYIVPGRELEMISIDSCWPSAAGWTVKGQVTVARALAPNAGNGDALAPPHNIDRSSRASLPLPLRHGPRNAD